jgi:hypothetical protein
MPFRYWILNHARHWKRIWWAQCINGHCGRRCYVVGFLIHFLMLTWEYITYTEFHTDSNLTFLHMSILMSYWYLCYLLWYCVCLDGIPESWLQLQGVCMSKLIASLTSFLFVDWIIGSFSCICDWM